jgi:hypothetical protein
MEAPRRFLLADAAVLMAATALGLAVSLPYQAELSPLDCKPPSSLAPPVRLVLPPIRPGDQASRTDLQI